MKRIACVLGILLACAATAHARASPEYERKQRVKRHLRRSYLAFKRSSI
jgi:hypothetical protein